MKKEKIELRLDYLRELLFQWDWKKDNPKYKREIQELKELIKYWEKMLICK